MLVGDPNCLMQRSAMMQGFRSDATGAILPSSGFLARNAEAEEHNWCAGRMGDVQTPAAFLLDRGEPGR